MVHYKLIARFASVQEDQDAVVVGFSDDQFDVTQYVTIQFSPDQCGADSELQQDGLHIERDDQSFSCYLGIEKISRVSDRIEIALTETGQNRLKVRQVTIIPTPWTPVVDQGLARIAQFLGRKEPGAPAVGNND